MSIVGIGKNVMGSGCGPVGSAVASDTRDTLFESSRRQFFTNFIDKTNMLTVIDHIVNCIG